MRARRPSAVRLALQLANFVRTHPAVRGKRTQAYGRVLRWQSRRFRGVARARIRIGPMSLYCYPQSGGASAILYVGIPEWDAMQFMLRALRPGDEFLDVGANIGAFSLLACIFAGANVTAVEPDPTSASRLRENLSLNRLDSVHVVESAVGPRPGTASFTVGLDTMNRLAVAGDSVTQRVSVTTIDDLAHDHSFELIKIDVEGAERAVFEGGDRTLLGPRPPHLLFELNDCCEAFGLTRAEVTHHLVERGFELFEFDADRNDLIPYDSSRLPRGGNAIATRRPRELCERLASAPRISATQPPVPVEVELERIGADA